MGVEVQQKAVDDISHQQLNSVDNDFERRFNDVSKCHFVLNDPQLYDIRQKYNNWVFRNYGYNNQLTKSSLFNSFAVLSVVSFQLTFISVQLTQLTSHQLLWQFQLLQYETIHKTQNHQQGLLNIYLTTYSTCVSVSARRSIWVESRIINTITKHLKVTKKAF